MKKKRLLPLGILAVLVLAALIYTRPMTLQESGKVDIAGALGALDFESVSGDLILATERALRLDAETESGSIYLTLPAQDGFTLDYETKSGAFRSALTEREGTLIACGDRETHYSVPALDGGAVSVLTIETMSGEVTIGASSSGSN